MELRDITFGDLPLYEALMTDPRAMAQLGGPLPRAGLAHKVRSLVDGIRAGDIWYLTIVPDAATGPVGAVCLPQERVRAARGARVRVSGLADARGPLADRPNALTPARPREPPRDVVRPFW